MGSSALFEPKKEPTFSNTKHKFIAAKNGALFWEIKPILAIILSFHAG